MLYYYRGFDGPVFDWLDYVHDNTGNLMVDFAGLRGMLYYYR
jgi:hypothetical protein